VNVAVSGKALTMRDDEVLGRDAELGLLDQLLDRGASALVLVTGGPRSGKSRLLRALRPRAHSRHWLVLPDDSASEGVFTVDKATTIAELEMALCPSVPEAGSDWVETLDARQRQLVLARGYRPTEEVHEWFVAELLRPAEATGPPRIVVVAGDARDLERLEQHAAKQIELGPLPREPVVAALRSLDATLKDPLEDKELEAYAEAIRLDPSLLEPLRRVLTLTTHAAPTGSVDGER
jgi:AAA ATPase domain